MEKEGQVQWNMNWEDRRDTNKRCPENDWFSTFYTRINIT